jgi:DNA-binding transcriptional LysR family regulator
VELRHLRYFLSVCRSGSFTKAAAELRIAQPALSRQIQDLEAEIGVDLFRRGTRGVTLTVEGELFQREADRLLQDAGESVRKVRALARVEFGELHVGYSPSPTSEILPPALMEFRKANPGVKVILHDLAGDKLCAALREGSVELAVTPRHPREEGLGIIFEELLRYRLGAAVHPGHRFAGLKSISVKKAAAEPLIVLRRREYSAYHGLLERLFSPLKLHPNIVAECDSVSSLITEVKGGRGIAVVVEVVGQGAGDRLIYVPFSASKVTYQIGICRATNGELTPAGERFCAALRQVSAWVSTDSKSPKKILTAGLTSWSPLPRRL